MTDGMTMTPEIAASILDGTSKYRPHPTHVEDAKLFAARVLRSVAAASADAEKGFEAWVVSRVLRWESDLVVNTIEKPAYLAGHAAATAAMQAEVDELKSQLSAQNAAQPGETA